MDRLKKTIILFGFLMLFHAILGSAVYPQEELKQEQEESQEYGELPLSNLSYLKGVVEYKVNEKADWQEARAGTTLELNHILKTGVESYATIIFFDGSKIRVEENTIVTIKKLQADLDKKGEFKQGNIGISVLLGEVAAKLEKVKMKEREFEIESPGSLIGVRGTFFVVKVDRSKKTYILVLRGKVSVKNVRARILQKVKEISVGAGQGTEVEQGKLPSKARNLSRLEISSLEKREETILKEENQVIFQW